MAGLERHADFAVGLEAADARTMSGARVDNNERPPLRIDFDACRRDDPHEDIIDGPVKRPAIDHELHLIVEHMRNRLGQMLAVLVAALPHDIPEQNAPLSGIDHVIHGRGEHAKRRRKRARQGRILLS